MVPLSYLINAYKHVFLIMLTVPWVRTSIWNKYLFVFPEIVDHEKAINGLKIAMSPSESTAHEMMAVHVEVRQGSTVSV